MNPIHDFRDQVALVTGAASGIELATATAFAESGAAGVRGRHLDLARAALTCPQKSEWHIDRSSAAPAEVL